MTKLKGMFFPKKIKTTYCKICNQWVPDIDKHNKKRHPTLK